MKNRKIQYAVIMAIPILYIVFFALAVKNEKLKYGDCWNHGGSIQRTACMEYKYGIKKIDYVELLEEQGIEYSERKTKKIEQLEGAIDFRLDAISFDAVTEFQSGMIYEIRCLIVEVEKMKTDKEYISNGDCYYPKNNN